MSVAHRAARNPRLPAAAALTTVMPDLGTGTRLSKNTINIVKNPN